LDDVVPKLVYGAITSLDLCVADAGGSFDWAMPSEEVHAFVNDLEWSHGTFLYGRRLYEVMRSWETAPTRTEPGDGDPSDVELDYAEIWQAADKIVYSTTIDEAEVTTARTRLERAFDPDAVSRLKETADRDLTVGGPHLAAHALRAGLVDEVHLFLNPVVVGAGNRAFPDDVRISLDLVDNQKFANGVVHLHYRVIP
jgi:dihydrofolate reductase